MTKGELTAAVQAVKAETKNALEIVLAELNQGQRKKLVRNETVKALLDRYGVDYEN